MMPDKEMTYRVNIDDSNFQAKISQMRASMDANLGGAIGGGIGAMSPNMMYGMMNAMGGGGYSGYGPGYAGGLAGMGSSVMPISYTPPPLAMTPYFGMSQLHQTFGQAGAAALGGPLFAQAYQSINNFRNNGIHGLLRGPDAIPYNMSAGDYMTNSIRSFGAAASDKLTAGAIGATEFGASMAASSIGYSAGAAVFGGAGVMGMVGGIAGATLAAAPVAAYFGAVTDQVASNRANQAHLAQSSFRYITGGRDVDRLTGRGFSLQARTDISKSIQDMELNDVRFGMNEYQDILRSGTEAGIFDGTRDAEDFKRKFKGLVESVKTVTATMNASLKEATDFIRSMRDMGATGGDVLRLATQSDTFGRMSGRTAMEMSAIGQAGAEIFRGTGVNMQLGFSLNQKNLVDIRQMRNAGIITQETISQAGGEEAYAQRLTANTLSGMQDTVGRGMLLAAYDAKTKSFDVGKILDGVSGGAMGLYQNSLANQNVQNIASLSANMNEAVSKMSASEMQVFNMAKISAIAKTASDMRGTSFEDEFKLAGRNLGLDSETIKAWRGMLDQDPAELQDTLRLNARNQMRNAMMEDVRNKYGIKRFGNYLMRGLVQPVSDTFVDARSEIEQGLENFGFSMMGMTSGRSVASKYWSDLGSQMTEEDRLGTVSDATAGLIDTFVGASSSDLMGSVLSGKEISVGSETWRKSAAGVMGRSFKSREEMIEYQKRTKQKLRLISDGGDGNLFAVTEDSISKATKDASDLSFTDEEYESARKKQSSWTRNQIKDIANSRNGQASLDEIAGIAFKGKSFGDLTRDEKLMVASYMQGSGNDRAEDELYEKMNISGVIGSNQRDYDNKIKAAENAMAEAKDLVSEKYADSSYGVVDNILGNLSLGTTNEARINKALRDESVIEAISKNIDKGASGRVAIQEAISKATGGKVSANEASVRDAVRGLMTDKDFVDKIKAKSKDIGSLVGQANERLFTGDEDKSSGLAVSGAGPEGMMQQQQVVNSIQQSMKMTLELAEQVKKIIQDNKKQMGGY